jgi:hypothetical protein
MAGSSLAENSYQGVLILDCKRETTDRITTLVSQ